MTFAEMFEWLRDDLVNLPDAGEMETSFDCLERIEARLRVYEDALRALHVWVDDESPMDAPPEDPDADIYAVGYGDAQSRVYRLLPALPDPQPLAQPPEGTKE